MIAVVQRVAHARVTIAGASVGEIELGVLILLGVAEGDGEKEIEYLTGKIANMRIFDNEEGKFDHSLLDINGSALVVSQFTLLGNWRKGRRPGFDSAAAPADAEKMVELFVKKLEDLSIHVETGLFGAHMEVELINDGPVTFTMDTSEKK